MESVPVRRLSLLLVLLTAAMPQVMAERASQRRLPPAAEEARPFSFPPTREFSLPNGLAVSLVEDHRTPLATIEMAIPAGVASESPQQPGLASATADLLTEGSGSKTAEQIAWEIESAGAEISVAADHDFTTVSATVVSENLERLIDLLGEIVQAPAFSENEVELYRGNRIEKLKVEHQDPDFLADEHLSRVIYRGHPYGRISPTPDAIRSLTRTKLENFHRSHYTPHRSVLVAVGDFEFSRVAEKLCSVFGDWRSKGDEASDLPKIAGPSKRVIYLIDRPASEQTTIRIGRAAVSHADPDYFPLLVATTILGGGASSRLFIDLRERRGYAYDASASLEALLQGGAFYAATETRPETTVSAIREMLAAFKLIATRAVTPAELRKAKNFLNGTFSLSLSMQSGIAEHIALVRAMGLGRDYLNTYRDRIESISADDVLRVSRRYIANPAAIIVVGDARQLKPQLARLGHVEVTKP